VAGAHGAVEPAGQEQACARMEDLVFEDTELVPTAMAENLVIVESPAKAKTIKKYLGKDFEVLASYGHVRDLVPKEGAVDPDKQFKMNYQSIERNEKHVDAIARALKKSKSLYLATDPDREASDLLAPA
jgi:reverse gyrase